jgi:hypothetical protein
MLALEWVAAERALRMRERAPAGPLAPARELAAAFDGALEDRPIRADAERAEGALAALAQLVVAARPPDSAS